MDLRFPLALWTLTIFVICLLRPRIFGRSEQQVGFVAGVNFMIFVYTTASMIMPLLKS